MSVTGVEAGVLRALVVDDTPDIRMLLRLALEEHGQIEVVAEAGNGLEGVEAAGRNQPHLVMLDLAMPVMDGLEALPMIREVSPKSRVIVLSGFDAATMAERALEAGADGYVQKGLAPSAIHDYVLDLVRGERTAPQVVPQRDHSARVQRWSGARDLARRAADEAPVGLLMLEDPGETCLVGWANARACALLGWADPAPGTRTLHDVHGELASLVQGQRCRLQDGHAVRSSIQVGDRVLTATLETVDQHVLVTLQEPPQADEQDRLRRVLSTTAHEMRNPLTVLRGVADTLRVRSGDLDDQQRDQLLAAVARQTTMLERITDDLLVAARAQRGALRLDLETVRLAEVVGATVADLPSRVDVTVTGVESLSVLADRTRLDQMLANLLTNAVKYGAPPLEIHAERSTVHDRRMVLVSVSDCGAGVPEDFRDRMFEEFTRADPNNRMGAGLGLFIVRSLAIAQGGWVEHRPRPGGGSIFTLALPEAAEPAQGPGFVGQSRRPDSV